MDPVQNNKGTNDRVEAEADAAGLAASFANAATAERPNTGTPPAAPSGTGSPAAPRAGSSATPGPNNRRQAAGGQTGAGSRGTGAPTGGSGDGTRHYAILPDDSRGGSDQSEDGDRDGENGGLARILGQTGIELTFRPLPSFEATLHRDDDAGPSDGRGGPSQPTSDRPQGETTPQAVVPFAPQPPLSSGSVSETSRPERQSNLASVDYIAGPFADRFVLGEDLKALGDPHPRLRWDQDLTTVQRMKSLPPSDSPEGPSAAGAADAAPPEGFYKPVSQLPRFPEAAKETIDRRCRLYAHQLLNPESIDAALTPLSVLSKDKLGGGYEALTKTLRPDLAVKRAKDEGYAGEIESAMKNGAAYREFVGTLFRLPEGSFRHSSLRGELQRLDRSGSSPLPFARRLVAAVVSASVFNGDPRRAAEAMEAIREGHLKIENLSVGGANQSIKSAFMLAGALASVSGEGMAVLKNMLHGQSVLDDTEKGREQFVLLHVALQTYHIKMRRPAINVETSGEGMEMENLDVTASPANPAPPPPLQLQSTSKASARERRDFASDVHGSVLKAASGSADISDKANIFAWNGGKRSKTQMKQTEDLLETVFAEWPLRAKENAVDMVGKFLPFATALSVVTSGTQFLIDGEAAAKGVPSPFSMLKDWGLIGTNVDWAPQVQKSYNIAMQEAAESLLETLNNAMEHAANFKRPTLLKLKFAEQRLGDVLARGRSDKETGPAVKVRTLRAEGGVGVPTGIAPESERKRLDLVPFEEEDLDRITNQIEEAMAAIPGERSRGYTRQERGQNDLRTLSSLPLSTLMGETIGLINKELAEAPPNSPLRTKLNNARGKFEEAQKIRQSEPFKAKSGELEDVIAVLREGADHNYLGNRQIWRSGHTAGLNRANINVVGGTTPLSGGPIVTGNLSMESQLVSLSGGPGQELACHVVARGTFALGGNLAVSALKSTGASKYASLALGARAEASMQFEKAIGIGLRADRPLNNEGLAYEVFKPGNKAGRPAGERYSKKEGDGVEESDVQDEYRYNSNRLIDAMEEYIAGKRDDEPVESGSLYRHLASKFVFNNRVAVVDERHSSSFQDITGTGSISISGRTQGDGQVNLGLTASVGGSARSSTINRSEARSDRQRGIVQHDVTSSKRSAAGVTVGLPTVPVENNPNVSGVGFNSTVFGASGSGFERGVGVSPRYFVKDGQIDPYNSTLDLLYRTMGEGEDAINKDRDGWEGMLGKENLANDIRELRREAGPDKVFALRYHGTSVQAQRENVSMALEGTIREFAETKNELESGKRKIESLIDHVATEKAKPENNIHQGIFLLEATFIRPAQGLNDVIQVQSQTSTNSEREVGFRGLGNGPVVAHGNKRLGLPVSNVGASVSGLRPTQEGMGQPAPGAGGAEDAPDVDL